MKQNDIKKLPMALMNAGLILHILFLICTMALVMAPEFFLKNFAEGYTGGYIMPFDYIHYVVALIDTVIFGVIYTLLLLNIRKGKILGMGFGFFLGILAYLSYFLATSVTSNLINSWVEVLGKDEAFLSGLMLTFGETIGYYAVLVAFHGIIKFALKTAIILVLVAFGVYCMRNRQAALPKKLY